MIGFTFEEDILVAALGWRMGRETEEPWEIKWKVIEKFRGLFLTDIRVKGKDMLPRLAIISLKSSIVNLSWAVDRNQIKAEVRREFPLLSIIFPSISIIFFCFCDKIA